MDTKTFDIGDIISVTSGRLISREHIGGVYKILGWMTGEDLMTHQLPRASRECEGTLREAFPDIAAIEVPEWPDATKDVVYAWLDGVAAEHGPTREVPRLAAEDHTPIDPIAELRMMRPDAEIIVVNPSE